MKFSCVFRPYFLKCDLWRLRYGDAKSRPPPRRGGGVNFFPTHEKKNLQKCWKARFFWVPIHMEFSILSVETQNFFASGGSIFHVTLFRFEPHRNIFGAYLSQSERRYPHSFEAHASLKFHDSQNAQTDDDSFHTSP